MRHGGIRSWRAFSGLAALLVLLAFARPLDHDESQYVAAAVLAWSGLPYRDFAYLQTPLQPLLFAPLTALAGAWTFPALRIVNALLGAAAAGLVYAGARTAGVGAGRAGVAAGLFASCDAFLFSADVARNDMLPAVLFAGALWLLLRRSDDRLLAARALAIGLLLSAGTAAKLSYAFPAVAIGGLALVDRHYRPALIALGALPPALFVAWTWYLAPDAFAFEVLRFPVAAPAQFYAAGRAWKLAVWARGLDLLKFLTLGPALLALIVVARDRRRGRALLLLDLLIVAGLIAAILPAPTWRQYLLPVLPPLFVRLALAWEAAPAGRPMRNAFAVFAAAGLAPSAVMLAGGVEHGLPLVTAIEQGRALRLALDRAQVTGPIATLSPQFIPATGRAIDPRFATGPFYFRNDRLLSAAEEQRFDLVSRRFAARALATRLPAAIVIGGEGAWTSGDPALDGVLQSVTVAQGWPEQAVPGTPFRIYVRPRAPARIGVGR